MLSVGSSFNFNSLSHSLRLKCPPSACADEIRQISDKCCTLITFSLNTEALASKAEKTLDRWHTFVLITSILSNLSEHLVCILKSLDLDWRARLPLDRFNRAANL